MNHEPNTPMAFRLFLRSGALIGLLIWQGGFTFYGGIVVPIGVKVLGSELEQGLVTQAVTHWLNLLGAVGLGSWLLAFLLTPWRAGRFMTHAAIGAWCTASLAWLALIVLHAEMDVLIDQKSRSVLDSDAFYLRHRVYLILSTLQWGLVLAMVPLSLFGWRESVPPVLGTLPANQA